MKMKKCLLMLSIALICSACSEEEPPVNPTPEKKLVSVGANIEKSRVHFTGGKTVWDATDIIGAFATDNANIRFSTSVGNLGTFTSLVSGNPTDYYFYFPYNASATMSNGLLSTELSATQSLLAGSYSPSLPLGGYIESISEPLQMNNLCGLLCLTVKSNIDRVLTRLTFNSNDATPVSGKYTVDLASSEPNLNLAATGSSSTSLEGNVAISANEEYKFYVILPPSVHSKGFTITLEDSKSRTCEQTFVKELTVARSVITNVKTVIEFNSEIEEEEATNSNAQWIWATSDAIVNSVSTSTVYDATDLSLDGQALANCYIVSKAGTYSIPALKPDGTAVDTTNPDVVINFTTSGIEGNAVIAYLNEAGEILWSWHIWCTDKPADQLWNANTWLDRNLGAVTAVSGDVGSYGLMYQWGRKDPFPGSKLYSWSGTNDETTAFSTDYTYNTVINGNYAWQYSSGTGLTIDEAIAQPMHMCQNATNTTDEEPDPSCDDGSKNFNKVTRPWVAGMCAVEYSKLWLDDQKTIYDPCPAGYRVPTQAQVKADFSDLTDQFTTSGKTNGLTLSSVNCWLPAAGYRTYDGNGKLFKVGTMGHYWTSTTYFPRSSNHHYGATFYTMAIRETTSGVYGITSNGQLKASENAAVRCVKE